MTAGTTWRRMRIKFGFEKIGSGTTPDSRRIDYYDGGTPWLTSSELHDGTVTQFQQSVTAIALRDYSALKVYPVGSLVVAMYGATMGRMGILGFPTAVNQACCVFAKPTTLDPRFTLYSLLTNRAELLRQAVGAGQPNLNSQTVANVSVLAPPIAIQRLIVDFLDREVSKIDDLIAKKQRLIELLDEKRTALISRSVTQGLDPSVPMEDSGVPWLGQVPRHWNIRRLGTLAVVVRGSSPRPAGSPEFFNGDHTPWITVGDITRDTGKYLDQTETFLTRDGTKLSRLIPVGTLLLTNSGATLGIPKITRLAGCINDGSVAFLRLSPDVDQGYLYYFLLSATKDMRERLRQGAGQPNLNTDLVKGSLMPTPPKLEQQRIVFELDECTRQISITEKSVRQAIALLQEYRSALITATVTGQLDIREHEPKMEALA